MDEVNGWPKLAVQIASNFRIYVAWSPPEPSLLAAIVRFAPFLAGLAASARASPRLRQGAQDGRARRSVFPR